MPGRFRSQNDIGNENPQKLSILKLFVMFSSGLSSVCHFGHDGEIMGVIPRSGTRCVPGAAAAPTRPPSPSATTVAAWLERIGRPGISSRRKTALSTRPPKDLWPIACKLAPVPTTLTMHR